jgi:hypothetical protein
MERSTLGTPGAVIRKVFLSRSTVALPVMCLGAYLSYEALSSGVDYLWALNNKGKSFKDMLASLPPKEEDE